MITNNDKVILRSVIFIALVVFFYSTISINVTSTSVISATVVISFFLLNIFLQKLYDVKPIDFRKNPLKGNQRSQISDEDEISIKSKVYDFVTYDATNVTSLEHFSVVKNQSACIFAKKAVIWGSPEWNNELNLEENIFRLLPTLLVFTLKCSRSNIDGFLIELPGEKYCSSLKDFRHSVASVLKVLSDNDPGGGFSMTKSYIDKPGWVFEFNHITWFITTFAPFYPDSNSRYNYGSKYGYILLQPEISFAHYDLPPDTPVTNWNHPQTIRDRIRVGFKDNGQEYSVPSTVHPMVYDIVKPLNNHDDSQVQWWKSCFQLGCYPKSAGNEICL